MGIPYRILDNGFDHRRPHAADRGLTFLQRPDALPNPFTWQEDLGL